MVNGRSMSIIITRKILNNFYFQNPKKNVNKNLDLTVKEIKKFLTIFKIESLQMKKKIKELYFK